MTHLHPFTTSVLDTRASSIKYRSINGTRNSNVYICSDTSRKNSDLCSAVRRGSRREIRFGMDTVVSCALPDASTTGMSASVPLPRAAMLVCLSLQQTIGSADSRRGGKRRGREHRGASSGGWGVKRVWGGLFSFSFIFLQLHSWLLPHWWWLVLESTVYSRAYWPDWLSSLWHRAPGTQHCPATATSLSHPSPIPPWVLIMSPTGAWKSLREFYWPAIVFSSVDKAKECII